MPFRRPIDLWLLALWCGLFAALGEFTILAYVKFVRRYMLQRSPDLLWMIPAVDLVLFAVPGLVVALVAWRWPDRIRWWAVFAVYLFVACAFVLLMLVEIHPVASLMLALGIAVQGTRLARAHPQGFERLVRRSTVALVLLVALLAVGMPTGRLVAERIGRARLPPAPADAPNVLLLILDTVRARSLGLYGYPRPTTPELERLAERGVVFEHAFAAAPWTLPSHASMFTGRFPYELVANWQTPFGKGPTTLAEVLRDRGYVTAGVVANLGYTARESGLARGFVHYDDYQVSLQQTFFTTGLGLIHYPRTRRRLQRHLRGYEAFGGIRLPRPDAHRDVAAIGDSFLRWLDDAGSERPFFAFLNFMDAHLPYDPPAEYLRRFRLQPVGPISPEAWAVTPQRPLTPNDLQPKMGVYDASIAYLDAQLGRLFAELEARGRLRNTLVVITSDHGDEFAEHGLVDHGHTLYRPSVEVPLIVIFPGRVPAGRRIETPVSLRNIAATIHEVTGGGGAPLPGRSLARHWREPGVHPPDTLLASVRQVWNQPSWYPASRGDLHSIAFDGLRYIANAGDGGEELYDFRRDPLEQTDLSDSPEGRAALPRYRDALARMLASDSADGLASR